MINSVVDIAPGPDWAAAYEEERGTLMVCEDLGSAHPHCSLTTPSVPMRVPGTGIGYLYRGTPASPDLTKRLAAVGGLLAFARKDIYLSPDHGRTWTDMGPPAGLTPIVIRPFQGRFYVAGVDSAAAPPVPWVALSPDSGRTWSRLGRALPGTRSSWTLAFRPGEIYAGTDSGVFRWKEGGAAWEALNDGLIDREVCDLALSGDRLVAGMASGSVWEMDLEPDGVRPDRTARAGAPKPRVPGIFPDGAGGWRRLDGSALRSRNRPGSRHGS
jgi:hypothetical protein